MTIRYVYGNKDFLTLQRVVEFLLESLVCCDFFVRHFPIGYMRSAREEIRVFERIVSRKFSKFTCKQLQAKIYHPISKPFFWVKHVYFTVEQADSAGMLLIKSEVRLLGWVFTGYILTYIVIIYARTVK